jgi:hypothetical protein
MISPVCSRLREHIYMLNGNSQKERLFLHSPMTNNIGWPIASPAINNGSRALNQGSTAPNTSTCQKYVTSHTQEGHSDAKMGDGMDSPLAVRRFIDHDSSHAVGLMATLNKNLQRSDYKVFGAVGD